MTISTTQQPKRRGRSTSKIRDAFNHITTSQQSVVEFCSEHKISEHCVRQHKRFAPERDDIVVSKVNGVNVVYKKA